MSDFDLKEEALAKLGEFGRLDADLPTFTALSAMRETLTVLLNNHVRSGDCCADCTGEEMIRWPCWYVRKIAEGLGIKDEWWKREIQR